MSHGGTRPSINAASQAIAAAGGDMAKAALATGLIDRIGDRTAFEARLAQLGGSKTNEPGGYSRIRLASYIADKVDQKPRGPIGIVTIAGTIVDGRAAPGSAASQRCRRPSTRWRGPRRSGRS